MIAPLLLQAVKSDQRKDLTDGEEFEGDHPDRRFWDAGTALTGLVRLEELLRFVPNGLAVVLEFEVTGLLPGRGADLEEVSSLQQELEVMVALHTCEHRGGEAKNTFFWESKPTQFLNFTRTSRDVHTHTHTHTCTPGRLHKGICRPQLTEDLRVRLYRGLVPGVPELLLGSAEFRLSSQAGHGAPRC